MRSTIEEKIDDLIFKTFMQRNYIPKEAQKWKMAGIALGFYRGEVVRSSAVPEVVDHLLLTD